MVRHRRVAARPDRSRTRSNGGPHERRGAAYRGGARWHAVRRHTRRSESVAITAPSLVGSVVDWSVEQFAREIGVGSAHQETYGKDERHAGKRTAGSVGEDL